MGKKHPTKAKLVVIHDAAVSFLDALRTYTTTLQGQPAGVAVGFPQLAKATTHLEATINPRHYPNGSFKRQTYITSVCDWPLSAMTGEPRSQYIAPPNPSDLFPVITLPTIRGEASLQYTAPP